MEGPALVTRTLSILSEGDARSNPTAQASLLRYTTELGITAPDPAPNPGPACEHGDDEDPSRPESRLDLSAAELAAAL